MKYLIEIKETPETLKKYLHSIIGKKYLLFESRKIVGKIKKNRIQLEYNNIWNRFPVGIIFYGKIISKPNSSIISGYFILSSFAILFYGGILFIEGIIYFESSHFDGFFFVIGGVHFILNFYFSYKQKRHIVKFLNEVKNYYNG